MATITEDYVSFEVAKLLKEKGFDSDKVGCYGGFYSERYYESGHGIKTQSGQEVGIVYDDLTNSDLEHDEYLRPTLQMAMKWLREVYNIFIVIEPHMYDYINEKNSSCVASLWQGDNYYENITSKDYKTYEEAVEATIQYSLKNLI